MVRKLGIPPENLDPLRYAGPRYNLTPTVEAVRRPEVYDRNYPLFTFWRLAAPVSGTGNEGEIWYLSRFADSGDVTFNPGDAVWLMLGSGSSGAITNLRTDDGNLVSPLAGIIDVDGIIVANATNSKPLFTDGATANTARWELQVGAAITGAPADTNDAGIVSFDDTHFTVDINGFVSLIGGGQAIDQINVDASTPPGTNPVLPTAAGEITVTGGQVAAGTIGANAIRTNSLAANTYTIEIQRTDDFSSSSVNNAGISSFDTQYFDVDSNAWVRSKSGLMPGVSNLGFSYNSGTGTFTVHGHNGNALSASNPAYVTTQSVTNPGQLITISITANQSFTDAAGTNEISGNNFGVTAGVAWATDAPFFLYAVPNDNEDTIAFMISRIPARVTAPVAGNIGQAGSPLATTQGSFFSLLGITEADYASNPCLVIGSFRMRKTTTANDWTVQTITISGSAEDGIGRFQDSITFQFPSGQNGAATGTFMKNNGGTAPIFNTSVYRYKVFRDGAVLNTLNLTGDGGTDGAGAVTSQVATPFEINTLSDVFSGFSFSLNSVGSGLIVAYPVPLDGQTHFTISNGTTSIQNNSFSNGGRHIQGNVVYQLNSA